MMQKYLGQQIRCNIQVYIDDVVITTRIESMLIDDLREIFDGLYKYHLKLNPTKCSFGFSAGQLLRFFVSVRGMEDMAEWLELQNASPPDLLSVWTVYFDGSKRVEGARAGVVLISP
jgi:hypothetical protein